MAEEQKKKKLLLVVRDMNGRMGQNSFNGKEDIFTLREEKYYDETCYIVPKSFEEFSEIKEEYEKKGWKVEEREIFA